MGGRSWKLACKSPQAQGCCAGSTTVAMQDFATEMRQELRFATGS